MWFYLLTNSELSGLAKLAKPYPMSGPTYMPQILNPHHGISSCAHEVLMIVFWARLMTVFTLKPFVLFIIY